MAKTLEELRKEWNEELQREEGPEFLKKLIRSSLPSLITYQAPGNFPSLKYTSNFCRSSNNSRSWQDNSTPFAFSSGLGSSPALAACSYRLKDNFRDDHPINRPLAPLHSPQADYAPHLEINYTSLFISAYEHSG